MVMTIILSAFNYNNWWLYSMCISKLAPRHNAAAVDLMTDTSCV